MPVRKSSRCLTNWPSLPPVAVSVPPACVVVDYYGWLTIVAAPIFWCLELIHKMVGNWGWAIVLLTIGIKLLFFPLSAASYKSMAKMKAITFLQALRERCGGDKRNQHGDDGAVQARRSARSAVACRSRSRFRCSLPCTGRCWALWKCAMPRGSSGLPIFRRRTPITFCR